jgi:hypothetical protein
VNHRAQAVPSQFEVGYGCEAEFGLLHDGHPLAEGLKAAEIPDPGFLRPFITFRSSLAAARLDS